MSAEKFQIIAKFAGSKFCVCFVFGKARKDDALTHQAKVCSHLPFLWLTMLAGGSDAAVAQLTRRNCRIDPLTLSRARTHRKSLKKRPAAEQCTVCERAASTCGNSSELHTYYSTQARKFSNCCAWFCKGGFLLRARRRHPWRGGRTRRPITCCLKSWHVVIARDIKRRWQGFNLYRGVTEPVSIIHNVMLAKQKPCLFYCGEDYGLCCFHTLNFCVCIVMIDLK